MTEITGNIGYSAKPRYAVDIVAFAAALIVAPFWVALLGFWALLIPVFAIPIGGVAYLILGTPILLIYLHFRQGTPEGAAGLALVAVAAGLVVLLGLDQAYSRFPNPAGILGIGGFSFVMGGLWGLTFGHLYNRWRSDLSRQPIPQA
ncbi:MAG: hypothetical protein AAFP16_14980 [Pseudomonadota bacterium]